MKNYWDQQRMINLEYYLCYVKEQDSQHCKPYSTSLITHNACMEKYGSKPFVKTLVKVKSVISLDMMPTLDFGHHTLKNMQSLSKKVTILQLKDKWNCNSSCTL